MKEYYYTQDNSSHWYIVPVENKEAFDEWCELPEENEASWDAPNYADMTGGGPESTEYVMVSRKELSEIEEKAWQYDECNK